jgi:hypothetical protein
MPRGRLVSRLGHRVGFLAGAASGQRAAGRGPLCRGRAVGAEAWHCSEWPGRRAAEFLGERCEGREREKVGGGAWEEEASG